MKTALKVALALLAVIAPWQGLSAQTVAASTATSSPQTEEKTAVKTIKVATTTAPEEESVVHLTPFEVTASRDVGYQATETMAGTRIRTELKDVGASITILTKEFLDDIGATNSASLLEYTPNAQTAGVLGTYTGVGNVQSVDESGNLRAPASAQRIRGLAAADNARNFYITDIPWAVTTSSASRSCAAPIQSSTDWAAPQAS